MCLKNLNFKLVNALTFLRKLKNVIMSILIGSNWILQINENELMYILIKKYVIRLLKYETKTFYMFKCTK